jgi:hypothetical protein
MNDLDELLIKIATKSNIRFEIQSLDHVIKVTYWCSKWQKNKCFEVDARLIQSEINEDRCGVFDESPAIKRRSALRQALKAALDEFSK